MDNPALAEQFMNYVSFDTFAAYQSKNGTIPTAICGLLPIELVTKSCIPGMPVDEYSLEWFDQDHVRGDNLWSTSILEIRFKGLQSKEIVPKTVVNPYVIDTYTPNLFFRFCGRLHGVYCPLQGTCGELRFAIWRVEKRIRDYG